MGGGFGYPGVVGDFTEEDEDWPRLILSATEELFLPVTTEEDLSFRENMPMIAVLPWYRSGVNRAANHRLPQNGQSAVL